jgi:predicted metal-dependent HD superfamily phosphohydrolase
MQLDKILAETENTVEQLFRDHQDPRLLYHNAQHTRDVVSAVITIVGQYALSEKESFPIIAAAWWHDTGYLFSGPENHEQVSAEKAIVYFTEKGIDEATIEAIRGCIMATKVPQQPHNLYEQIICDADLFHFGKPGFLDKSKMLKRENELYTGKEFTGTEWRAVTIGFMTGHKYFTEFALRELAPQKEEYLAEL